MLLIYEKYIDKSNGPSSQGAVVDWYFTLINFHYTTKYSKLIDPFVHCFQLFHINFHDYNISYSNITVGYSSKNAIIICEFIIFY